MDLLDFLHENYYMLVPALWVIGYAVKQTPNIPDWSTIWILLAFSIGFGTFAFGFTVDAIINGIIAAGVAVLGHQMFKQTREGNRMRKMMIEMEQKEKMAPIEDKSSEASKTNVNELPKGEEETRINETPKGEEAPTVNEAPKFDETTSMIMVPKVELEPIISEEPAVDNGESANQNKPEGT
ncbi:phage holin family protein [Bacillus sp. B15-48]|uniref:phage holin family protein n=1 Tax=Bacillus sp. B15-48 TaxID=1548601 RepID=UPI00193FCEDE|nr:phage holin family protein [Bacillus sp. B15-48]MBM4760868.1 hypothetical protein [Bacillus sp. B15-48]